MTTQSHFDATLFAFLEALRSNNNRTWFQAHRQRYERDVRGPMLRFIGDVGPHLWQISPRFVADAYVAAFLPPSPSAQGTPEALPQAIPRRLVRPR